MPTATATAIRQTPRWTWTADDLYFTGTVIDTHALITVVFRRGSQVQHVKVTPNTPIDECVARANRS